MGPQAPPGVTLETGVPPSANGGYSAGALFGALGPPPAPPGPWARL